MSQRRDEQGRGRPPDETDPKHRAGYARTLVTGLQAATGAAGITHKASCCAKGQNLTGQGWQVKGHHQPTHLHMKVQIEALG